MLSKLIATFSNCGKVLKIKYQKCINDENETM